MNEISELLRKDEARLRSKALFGEADGSLSMRIPGHQACLLLLTGSDEQRWVPFETMGNEAAGLHAAIYRSRHDAGAILVGRTPWSSALSNIGATIPTLFDEQARHIGVIGRPIAVGRPTRLCGALEGGANVLIYGDQRICLGTTANRLVFNAELFEKCAKAYVVALASGDRIRRVPSWASYIARGRMHRDRKRAAESYARGHIPKGMDAY